MASPIAFLERWQSNIATGLTQFIDNIYQPTLQLCLKYRYATLASFLAFLIISINAVSTGIARF